MSTLYVVLSDYTATDLFSRVVVLQVPRIERDLYYRSKCRQEKSG